MKIGRACAIFVQIENDKWTDEEKALAIHEVMNMPTHNGINKDCMIRVIKWLWNKRYKIKSEV